MKKAGHDFQETEARSRIRQAAGEIEQNAERFFWQLGQLIKLMPQFKNSGVRRGAAGFFVKGYLSEYRKAARSKHSLEINVELPVDSKIPFEPTALPTYVSHVGMVISGANFIKKEFGKEVETDLGKYATDIAALFPEAAQVYRSAQTSFRRTGQGGFGMKMLRLVDSEKNACPSLHAEIVALAYSRICDILDAHAKNPASYEPIKNLYFQRAVKILESVLLVKQHVVMDIAVGLAVVSGRDSSFSPTRAQKMVDAMFEKDRHGMDQTVINEVRVTILSIYNEVAARIKTKPKTPLPEVIVGYLKDFDNENRAANLRN